MDKRVLIGVLIFICPCFRASNCYAWDELPVAVIDPAGDPVAICYGESKAFDGSQSYDPDIPYWGWVILYNWCITDYYGGTFQCTGYSRNDTYVFDSLQRGPGIYRIDLWVIDDEYNESADCDSRFIFVVNVTIDDDPPTRDTIGWLPYQPPAQADIYYTIEPDSAWTPGSVWFYVRQGANLIDIEELPAQIGRQHTTWDGKDFNGNWVQPGEYTAIIEVSAGDLTCSGSHPIRVVGVSSVSWETYPDDVVVPPPGTDHGPNLALEWIGENEQRIFPDKKYYDDSTDPQHNEAAMRRKVRVVATVVPPIDNVHVYFNWWDVDDPSTSPIIDTYNLPGGQSGPDNYGQGASLYADSAVTDGSGQARLTFTVSMQPGDNFKVAASTNQTKIGQMTQPKADGLEMLPDTVVLSPLLTVWRELHVELDSMEQVATTGPDQNWATGLFDDGSCSYDPNTNTTIVDLGQDLADCWEETKFDHFVGGRFLVSGDPSWYSPLETISHYFDDEIRVSGNCVAGGLTPYYLMDGDDWNLLPRLPDTGKLNSIFDDCYIKCVDDAPGSSSDVAFKRNLGGATTSGSHIRNVTDPVRGSGAYESDGYWVVYVLSIFQPGYSYDWDPDSEGGPAGLTEDSWQAAVIPLENIRDAAAHCGYNATTLEQQAVVHEVGHQLLESGAHTSGTIMNNGLPVPSSQEKFGPAHIATIRSRNSSPGD